MNEGGFGGGGNLSFYDPIAGTIANDVIRNADQWLFPNDILLRSEKMYVAVNGSDRIDVVDPKTDSVQTTIIFPTGSGPGFLAAGNGLIYSANYNGSVTAIDPAADSILFSSGVVVGFPGDIVVTAGRIFISDLGAWPDTGISVKVLDGNTLTIVGSVNPGGGPARMALTGGKLYVGASVVPRIWRVDPDTYSIEDSCELGAIPGDLVTDGTDFFVLTRNAVERVPIASFERDSVALITLTEGLFHYAMGYDATTGQLYVSTITSLGGSGAIGVYSRVGVRVGPSVRAGIFPGAFGFYLAEPL